MIDSPAPARTYSTVKVYLKPRAVLFALSIGALGLLLLSVGGQVLRYKLGYPTLFGLIDKVYIDHENSIPTYYSGLLLLGAAVLLAGIGWIKSRANDRYATKWAGLAVLFGLLSVDEMVSIHELTINPLLFAFGFSGYLRFPWVILGLLLVAVVGVTYLRFLFHLPARSRNLFLLAGFLYVGGAVGIEAVGGNFVARNGENNFSYSLIATLEEGLEMAGVIVFIYTLLEYTNRFLVKHIAFENQPGTFR
jgi:hypothetical protein